MKRSLSFYFLLFTFLTLISCSNEKKNTNTGDEIIPVTTQPVTFMQYAPTLQYSGMIASATETKLSFKIGGIIARTYIKEGDHVSAGQLLATLDMTEINAQVQQSSQGAEKAQRDVNRMQNLFNDTAATLGTIAECKNTIECCE